MTRFNSKIAAAVATFLGVTYLVVGLASGHSARSEPPPDLSANAAEASLDVWKTAAALMDDGSKALVVDGRTAEEFARYHLPGSVSEPGVDAARLVAMAREHAPVIVVAAKDEQAQKLVGEARAAAKEARIHFLSSGARAWYLAFDLPVPLFAETEAPGDYDAALRAVKAYLASPAPGAKPQALEALRTLVKLNYQPTLLKQSGRPKAAAGAKKKISGGCG